MAWWEGVGYPLQTRKRQTTWSPGTIYVGDFPASPENCGMIHYVRPVYPKEAKRRHIQGEVRFRLAIARTGKTNELHGRERTAIA